MDEMICFRVVKEPYGWAVRMGQGMMTPFRFRHHASEHATGFAEALRRRGERAEVVIEGWPTEVKAERRSFSRFAPFRS